MDRKIVRDIQRVLKGDADISVLVPYLESTQVDVATKENLCDVIYHRNFTYLHKATFVKRDAQKEERPLYSCKYQPWELFVKVAQHEYIPVTDYLCSIGLMRPTQMEAS